MCGRFALRLDPGEIQELQGYNVHIGEWVDQEAFVPRYNIAPRTQAPVIRRRNASGPSEDPELVIHTMKWGLVPHWSKYEDKTLNTTNARSENLVEGGGMWGSIKGKKRCAVICQGYYEWLTKGKDKLPHFTKQKNGQLMLMAGLYDSVVLEGQTTPLWTFTIVTSSANKDMEWLHERMPVILSTEDELNQWLDTSSQQWTKDLERLVKPYHNKSSPLKCYQVPKEVGKVGTESSTFLEPIAQRKDGIQAMFSKQKQSQGTSSSRNIEKRKRDTSPNPPKKMEAKTQVDDEEVVILDTPPAKKTKTASGSLSKAKSPKKGGQGEGSITSFFSKSG